jgi:hypothetical protein
MLCVAADLKLDLSRRYRSWDTAYRRVDVAAIDNLLDRAFRIVTGTGSVIKRGDYINSLKKSKPPKEYATTLLRVERKGAKAYAWTEERSRHGDGPAKTHQYRDTWSLSGKTWLLLESKTLDKH